MNGFEGYPNTGKPPIQIDTGFQDRNSIGLERYRLNLRNWCNGVWGEYVSPPKPLGTHVTNTCKLSPCGRYVCNAQNSLAPRISVYDLCEYGFGRQQVYSTVHGNATDDVAWSPNGKYISAGADSTSRQNTYFFNRGVIGDRMNNPATVPAGQGFRTIWSPDSRYVCYTCGTTPYIFIYPISASGFGTVLAQPSPTHNATGVAWSPDGKFIAFVGDGSSSRISVYNWNDGIGAKVANPPTTPIGNASGSYSSVQWSPNMQYIAFSTDTVSATNPGVRIYKWNANGTFGRGFAPRTGQFVNGLSRRVNWVLWSPDSRYLSVTLSGFANVESSVTVYEIVNGHFARRVSIDANTPASVQGRFGRIAQWLPI